MKFLQWLLSLFCMGYAFQHDLHLHTIPGTNGRSIICCHGYGANYQIAEAIKNSGLIEATLVSFNFPDHDLDESFDPKKASFGTLKELMPALYALQKCVLEEGKEAIDLYGFSAGGAAVINLIAAIHGNQFKLGTGEKEKLLNAIRSGIVILDAPLKSVEEIIDLRGSNPELEWFAKNYRKNHCRPIDTLDSLKGLGLNIIIYFENPDEIVFNRDDEVFVAKLKQVGNTSVIVGSEGGHNALHMPLWKLYAQTVNGNY